MLRLRDQEDPDESESERSGLNRGRVDEDWAERPRPWWDKQNQRRKAGRRARASDAVVDCTVIFSVAGTFCLLLFMLLTFRKSIEIAWDRHFGMQGLRAAEARCVDPQVAIALAGDTWLGQTKIAALMTGMLQALIRKTGEVNAGRMKELLARFDVVSSSGSGTVYIAQLSFSPLFLRMQEEMGVAPQRAMEQWQASLDRFLQCAQTHVGTQSPENLYKLWACGRDSQLEPSGQAAKRFVERMQTESKNGSHFAWEQLTQQVMTCGADVPIGLDLGSHVTGAMQGKLWVISASLPTPGGDASYQNSTVAVPALSAQVRYRMSTEFYEEFPGYTPVKIAACLGLDRYFASPLHFCGRQDCFQYHVEYTVYDGGMTYRGSSPALWKLYYEEIESAPGRISVSSAVAASTACLGSLVFDADAPSGVAQWVTLDSDAPAFVQGTSFLNQGASFGENVASAPHAVVGGAFTDNTGILQAVASGASEVVALVGGVPFAGTAQYAGVCGFDNLLALFGIRMRHRLAYPDVTSVQFQIFETQDIRGAVETEFTTLVGPLATVNRSTVLSSIRFGSIQATTLTNSFAGIKGGRSIRLNLILVNSELNVESPNATVQQLPQLFGEIVSVLTSPNNSVQVQQLLNTFFLGAEPQ